MCCFFLLFPHFSDSCVSQGLWRNRCNGCEPRRNVITLGFSTKLYFPLLVSHPAKERMVGINSESLKKLAYEWSNAKMPTISTVSAASCARTKSISISPLFPVGAFLVFSWQHFHWILLFSFSCIFFHCTKNDLEWNWNCFSWFYAPAVVVLRVPGQAVFISRRLITYRKWHPMHCITVSMHHCHCYTFTM